MDTRKMKQDLQETNNILNGISVPMGLMMQISVPILNAMEKLQSVIGEIPDEPEVVQPIGRQEPDPNEEKAIREEDL